MAGSASLSRSSLLLGRCPELGLRALLRNLRLLKGLRARDVLDVVVAGAEAPAVAATVRELEPALRVTVVGDGSVGGGIDLRGFAGKGLAGVIICQPLHALSAPREELAAIRRALDPEEGALGFLWTRALRADWVNAFARAAAPTGSSSASLSSSPITPLVPGMSPLDWCDNHLNVTEHGFPPLKHRKFVERFEG